MKPYVIRQGDYLLKLSHVLGFDADEVWNHGKNAELKQSRKDPSLLKPGDVLFIPDKPKPRLKLNLKEQNSFVARVPSVDVAVVISEEGAPVKGAKYVVEGLGAETEQTTDEQGRVVIRAPVHAREVTVRFVERGNKLKIALGGLDPVETPSGLRMRLTNLGYYGGKLAGADPYVAHDDQALIAAVKAFQAANDLPATGEIDDGTRDAIVKAHGA